MVSNISLFALGGTIASRWDETERATSISLTADDLVRSLPGTGPDIVVQAHSFRLCPSGDLSTADIVALARAITSAATGGADGVVVAQGTNTLEETAFLLDYLVGTPRPVVVTGAMRSAGSAGADGPANLLAAFRVAASPLAINLGTLVVFDDEIHAARFVRKTHSFSTGAFRSVNAGPIGWVVEGRVRIPLIPRRRAPTVSLRIRGVGAASGRFAAPVPGRRRDAAEVPQPGRLRRSSGRRLWGRERVAANDSPSPGIGFGNARSFDFQDGSWGTLSIHCQFCRARA